MMTFLGLNSYPAFLVVSEFFMGVLNWLDKHQRCGHNCWIIHGALWWHFLVHTYLVVLRRNPPFYGHCPHWWIKQVNGQTGEIQGVIFLWSRGAWTIQLIFGHSHIWSGTKVHMELAKKKYRKRWAPIKSYLKQMDISDYSMSTTATLPNVEQNWCKDTLDWQNLWMATHYP